MEVKNCAKAPRPLKSYHAHSHSGKAEIVYQTFGSYTMNADGKNYKIKQGDVIIFPPDVVHSGVSDGDYYSDMYLQCTGCEFTEVHVVHDADGAILQLMEMIYRVTTEKGERYHEIADSLLEAICAYITKYINKKSRYDFVDGFKNTIYENLSNRELDITDEIKKSGYTPDHFRRCFKKETGMTPLEYVTALRVNRAKKLLLATPYQPIETIATGCGFSDEFYFSRVFKKLTGISPREYRKLHAG